MNHCLIQAVIKSAPEMRYTKENKTPIAEMTVLFKGLRDDDPSRELKVLGWGAIAQEMMEELKEGQGIVVEEQPLQVGQVADRCRYGACVRA